MIPLPVRNIDTQPRLCGQQRRKRDHPNAGQKRMGSEGNLRPQSRKKQAGPVNDAWWKYETEVPGNVLVQAFDLAGNVTRQEA